MMIRTRLCRITLLCTSAQSEILAEQDVPTDSLKLASELAVEIPVCRK